MRVLLSQIFVVVSASFVLGIVPGEAVAQTTTVPDDYLTIQLAIDAAATGGTVYVRSGTYHEHVIINKSLVLQGENRETTIIDGDGTGKVVTISSTNNVTVRGFTVRNSGTTIGSDQDAGVVLRNASNNLISDCILTSNGLNGLYSYGSSYNTIRNCDISHNEYPPVTGGGVRGAVHLRYSSHNMILDNNIFSNSRNGITARSPADFTTITGNFLYSNNGHGIHVGHSRYCNISNNLIRENLGSGVDFDSGSNHQVVNNTMDSNGGGIRTVFYSYRDTFIGNIIRENGFGIMVGGYELSSNSHVFYHNDIINNATQVLIKVSGSNTWDNGYPDGGNYWSDYSGSDSDNDGIGDTPYFINGSNQDNYPLMSPWNSLQVAVDIKPGSYPNCLNINGHGVIPLAVYGSAEFDVYSIDISTLLFAGMEVRLRGNRGPLCAYEYSNDDAFLDLVCHFEDQPEAWIPGDGEACLAGNLLQEFGGNPIEGCDSICIVP